MEITWALIFYYDNRKTLLMLRNVISEGSLNTKKNPHLGPRMVDDGNSKKPSPLNKAFFPNWTATTKQPISKSHWNRLNYTLPHASYFKELCTEKVKINPTAEVCKLSFL